MACFYVDRAKGWGKDHAKISQKAGVINTFSFYSKNGMEKSSYRINMINPSALFFFFLNDKNSFYSGTNAEDT